MTNGFLPFGPFTTPKKSNGLFQNASQNPQSLSVTDLSVWKWLRLSLSPGWTLPSSSDHIVPSLDFDVATDLHHYTEQSGLDIIVNNGVSEIFGEDNGLTVKLTCGSLSVGVKPDTRFLLGLGYDRYNLSGGFRLYESVVS